MALAGKGLTQMGKQIDTSAEYAENAVLARCHAVHIDPDSADPDMLEDMVDGQDLSQKSPAQWAYERMILYIQNFEKSLDGEEEVAMGFAGSDAGILRIEGMGYFDPDIVTFFGTDPDGAKTQLVQHVSQLSVILRAVPKLDENSTAHRIGFRLAKDLENSG